MVPHTSLQQQRVVVSMARSTARRPTRRGRRALGHDGPRCVLDVLLDLTLLATTYAVCMSCMYVQCATLVFPFCPQHVDFPAGRFIKIKFSPVTHTNHSTQTNTATHSLILTHSFNSVVPIPDGPRLFPHVGQIRTPDPRRP